MKTKKAVLLCSMGGPGNLSSVRPFLFNLFKDPFILRLPWGLRHILAFFLSIKRKKAAQEIYAKMGGYSPIAMNTKEQSKALEKELSIYEDYRCFIGMSYWKPFIKQALKEIKTYGAQEIILIPMYPQFSSTTSASVINEVTREVKKKFSKEVKLKIIPSFYDEESFIEAIVHQFWFFYQNAKKQDEPRILFSAHGLPQSIVDKGDPYVQQCEETVQAIIDRIGFEGLDWKLCYQSKVGPGQWTEPYTIDEVEKAAKEKKAILVVPISFVCEHAETIVELGQEYEAIARQHNVPYYGVVPTVQTHPAFIKGLSRLVTAC